MSDIMVGLQLYTLREECAEDFKGTLEKVATLGYQGVEFAGYYGLSAEELRQTLDELELKAISSHVSIQTLEEDLDACIAYNQILGAEYLVCPSLNMDTALRGEDNFNRTMALFRKVGEACQAAGMQFGYHNHAFEFEQEQGQYYLDKIYEAVDPALLQAELDLYWVKKAGLDPKEYMLRYAGRTPLVHVKDMTGDERQYFAEVGQGIIDYPAIFAVAAEAGVKYYIVEQDRCERPALESVKISIDYLKSLGLV